MSINKIFKFVLIPFLLALPILFFSIPLIHQGTDNPVIIRAVDNDEIGIIDFSARIYTEGLVPMNGFYFSYPQLFYYLSGIVLFPYTHFHGVDYAMITTVIRSFNVFFGIATVFLVFFITYKLFRSYFAALLAGLLTSTTPEYLWWLVNSRCHPMEIFFILLSLYMITKLLEAYSLKYMWMSLILISIAASTKYGGFILIPTLWLACVYDISKKDQVELKEYLKPRRDMITIISLSMFSAALCSGVGFLLAVYKFQWIFVKFGINHILKYVIFQTMLPLFGMLGTIALIGAMWFAINKLLKESKWVLALNKSTLVLCQIICIVTGIFILLNPTYWLFPYMTVKGTLYQIAQTTVGNTYIANSQPLKVSPFIWFKFFFDGNLLNAWFLILLFVYFIYEIVTWSKKLPDELISSLKRMVFLSYIAVLMTVLVIAVTHRAHHYILPVTLVLSILIAFISGQTFRIPDKRLRIAAYVCLFTILGAGFMARYEIIRDNYILKTAKIAVAKAQNK